MLLEQSIVSGFVIILSQKLIYVLKVLILFRFIECQPAQKGVFCLSAYAYMKSISLLYFRNDDGKLAGSYINPKHNLYKLLKENVEKPGIPALIFFSFMYVVVVV